MTAPASPLAARIDHTLLRPDAADADIRRLCDEALQWRFAAVCTHTAWTPLVLELLRNSGVAVCAVADFPMGASHPRLKAAQAADALALGADEVDVVLNPALIRAGDAAALSHEIALLRDATHGGVLKLILETAALSEDEKRFAAHLAVDGGADFLKTSTGFGAGGATEADVRLLAEVASGRARVKASGGIREAAFAQRLVEAGADRLGTSAGVALMREASTRDASRP